jgi:hypothetical protein
MSRAVRKTGLFVLALATLVVPTLSRDPVGAEQSAVSSGDIPLISVQVATDGPIDDANVALAPLPAGYAPGISSDEALKLAFEQLGPAASPTGALVYLGASQALDPSSGGVAVWVVTYEGVCGSPGSSTEAQLQAGPDCFRNTLSIALDAATGEFIVAW